jgi:CxxC-x17-CxxC domain-containing protein
MHSQQKGALERLVTTQSSRVIHITYISRTLWRLFLQLRRIGWLQVEFNTRVLTCALCGAEFVFSSDEQRFYHEKHFINDPKRCLPCRAKFAQGRLKVHSQESIVCAECGQSAVVPFKPVQNRPVLCRTCFEKQRRKSIPESQVLTPDAAPITTV